MTHKNKLELTHENKTDKKKRLALGTKETHLDASKNQTPIFRFYHTLTKKD